MLVLGKGNILEGVDPCRALPNCVRRQRDMLRIWAGGLSIVGAEKEGWGEHVRVEGLAEFWW